MSIPIIGSKNQANKQIKKREEIYAKYQQKKRSDLLSWELENKCIVTAILTNPKGPDHFAFQSRLEFRELNSEELDSYRNMTSKENLELLKHADEERNKS